MEVVAGGVAAAMGEIIATHAVIVHEMADDRFDRRTPFHFALDLGRDVSGLK